jgi:hypothetical protein
VVSLAHSFAAWLAATPVSQAFGASAPWAWPLAEIVHFVGLALLVGSAGAFDLRLLGLFRQVPVSAVRDFTRVAVIGFGMNVASGLYFVIAQVWQYVDNPAWWAKVGFLAVAGLNIALFETVLSGRIAALQPGADTPRSLKIAGALSLVAWCGVLCSGRMIAFVRPN